MDHSTARVRAVHLGTMLDLAGGAIPGYAGDGGPALDARFNAIADAEPLPGGGFLVADGRNCRLRRVTADGTVVPFAGAEPLGSAAPSRRAAASAIGDGGTADAAWLGVPGYLAVADDGSVSTPTSTTTGSAASVPTAASPTVAGTGETVGTAATVGPRWRRAWRGRAASRCGPPADCCSRTRATTGSACSTTPPPRRRRCPRTGRPASGRSQRSRIRRPQSGAASLHPVGCPPAPGPDPGCAGWVAVRAAGAVSAPQPFELAPGGARRSSSASGSRARSPDRVAAAGGRGPPHDAPALRPAPPRGRTLTLVLAATGAAGAAVHRPHGGSQVDPRAASARPWTAASASSCAASAAQQLPRPALAADARTRHVPRACRA